MVRFKVGRISRPGMGNWWYVEGITKEDQEHPFAQQQLYDGDLSFETFLWLAKQRFRIQEKDIVYIS